MSRASRRRPAIVLSSHLYHTSRPDGVVGLITSQTMALGPTDYTLQDWAVAGRESPVSFSRLFRDASAAVKPSVVGHLSRARLARGMRLCEESAGGSGTLSVPVRFVAAIRSASFLNLEQEPAAVPFYPCYGIDFDAQHLG